MGIPSLVSFDENGQNLVGILGTLDAVEISNREAAQDDGGLRYALNECCEGLCYGVHKNNYGLSYLQERPLCEAVLEGANRIPTFLPL